MAKYPPLTHKETERALKKLGFLPEKSSGTSHKQWKKSFPGQSPAVRKVTLSEHNSPYHRKILGYIIAQSGVSKEEFYRAADKVR